MGAHDELVFMTSAERTLHSLLSPRMATIFLNLFCIGL